MDQSLWNSPHCPEARDSNPARKEGRFAVRCWLLRDDRGIDEGAE
jgi:hypothetical protein